MNPNVTANPNANEYSATPLLAIDPGQSGAFALWDDGRITLSSMPKSEEKIVAFLRALSTQHPDLRIVMEKVGGYVKGKRSPGSAMFNFGDGYGFLRGVLAGFGMTVELVRPQDWQAPLGVPRGLTYDQRKAWLWEEAKRCYPELKVTKRACDALLILDWALTNCEYSDAKICLDNRHQMAR